MAVVCSANTRSVAKTPETGSSLPWRGRTRWSLRLSPGIIGSLANVPEVHFRLAPRPGEKSLTASGGLEVCRKSAIAPVSRRLLPVYAELLPQ